MSKFKVGDRVIKSNFNSVWQTLDTGVITRKHERKEYGWWVKWDSTNEELWIEEDCIELKFNTKQERHKHADLIIAWANGAEIQCEIATDDWADAKSPWWLPNNRYRIKPKPDYVENFKIKDFSVNVTFDGNTNKPKEAVLVNE
jgi:hypothetical protein